MFLKGSAMLRMYLCIILSFGTSLPPTLAKEIVTYKRPLFRSVKFVDDSHGWISGYRGVFFTSNGGNTWHRQPVPIGLKSRFTTTAAVEATGWIAWADVNCAIIRTDNGLAFGDARSKQWRNVNIPIEALTYMKAVAFIDKQHGWSVGQLGKISRTSDAGATWMDVKNNAWYDLLYGLFPLSATEIWAIGNEGTVLHTTDGGESWNRQALNDGKVNDSSLVSIQFINPQEGWICGSDGLIFHTIDRGEHWEMQNAPRLKRAFLTAVSFANENEGWITGFRYKNEETNGLIFHTRDGGRHWEERSIYTKDRLLSIQALSNGRAWAVGLNGTVLRTIDHGKNWVSIRLR